MPTMPECKSNLQKLDGTKQYSNQGRQRTQCLAVPPYACYACTQFAHYCHAATRPFKVCPETAAHTCRTVVVARIPDFSAYITDGGQGCTAAFVSFRIRSDHLKISAGKMQDVHTRQPFSPRVTRCISLHVKL